MKKILFDTDIGSDIDDAVCLAYLLQQPECELLGITTVSGEPEKRAMIASALCKVAGKEHIPIYPGVEQPLLTSQRQPMAAQAAVLPRWPHEKAFPKGEAIEFMRRTIRRHPGEVTLLAVGPLTNVALLFAVDAEIPLLLKELVLMCGVFTYKLPNSVTLTEWNALCDPYATKIVYDAPVRRIRSIGLDVTMQVVMSKEEVAASFTSKIMKPVFDFAGVWFQNTERIVFHDPLAATTIFDESICRFDKGDVSVETESAGLKGLTRFTLSPDNSKPAERKNEVATEVDTAAFFKHYFDVVGKY